MGWNRQQNRQAFLSGRKQLVDAARCGSGIALGNIEGQPIFKDASSMHQDDGAVAQRLGIELEPDHAIGLKPEVRDLEVSHLFEKATLHLKVVRPQVHAFRPFDFGKLLHGIDPKVRG